MIAKVRLAKIAKETDIEILQDYFEQKGVPIKAIQKDNISAKAFSQEIFELPDDKRFIILEDFEIISELANKDSIMYLYNNNKIKVNIANFESEYDKIFTILKHHREIVMQFYDLFIEKSSKKLWFSRGNKEFVKDFKIDQKSNKISNLQTAVKFYMKQHLKGDTYNIDLFTFDDNKKYCFLIKGEDVAQTIEKAENGKINTTTLHPIYEIAFVYNPIKGIIDVFCQDIAKARGDLLRIFAQNILEIEIIKNQKSLYFLDEIWSSIVNNQKINLGINPETTPSVISVEIKAIKLLDTADWSYVSFAIPDSNQSKISLQDKVFSTINSKISNFNLDSIQCAAEYIGYNKRKIYKKRFTISANSTCTLGHEGIDNEIKTALEKAGIISLQ